MGGGGGNGVERGNGVKGQGGNCGTVELGTLLVIFDPFSKQASMNWYCGKVFLGSSLIKQARVFF